MEIDESMSDEYTTWLDALFDEFDELEFASDDESSDEPIPDNISADLAEEREQELESELYLDEHPAELEEQDTSEIGQPVFRHEMLKTAIERIENAARTQHDFENVINSWDKLEQNEARRLRNHEVSRGDVPLEHGRVMDGAIIPRDYMQPRWQQIIRGNFWEAIHDCPFEMDELTAEVVISQALRDMKDEHKVIFYWHFLRQLSCVEIGKMRGQTDRNIRKTRAVIIGKLRKKLYKALQKEEADGSIFTARQRRFLEQMDTSPLTQT